MQRNLSTIHILRQPRTLPKNIVWLVYSVILALTLLALLAVLILAPADGKVPRSGEIRSPVYRPRIYPLISEVAEKSTSAQGLAELEEVAAYQYNFEPSINNISWLEGSDDLVLYPDVFGHPWLMNVTDGHTYPFVEKSPPITTSFADHHNFQVPLFPSHSIKVRNYRNLDVKDDNVKKTDAVGLFDIFNYELPRNDSIGIQVDRTQYQRDTDLEAARSAVQSTAIAQNCYDNEDQDGECQLLRRAAEVFSRDRRWRRHVEQFSFSSTETRVPPTPSTRWFLDDSTRRRCDSTLVKNVADRVTIGETGWLLHAIVHTRSDDHKVFNLAVSRAESYYKLRSMPRSGEHYRPLLGDEICMTQILAARIVGEDEAIAYFIGAPATDLQLRHLYRIKVVYPPLEYSTLEPVQCMTCPEGGQADTNEFELSSPGRRPQCSWAEVFMSNTSKNYILKCRGKEVPWVAIISSSSNLVVRRLNPLSTLREEYASKAQPFQQEFELELKDGFRIQARLQLPPSVNWPEIWDRCPERPRLLLRIASKQNDQLVHARYELSLATYLATVGGYAVLSADVRASKFHSLDVLGLRFRQREAMQIEDYVKIARHVFQKFDCLDARAGIGVFGEAYGGHVALSLAAHEDREVDFRCALALTPFAPWHAYVYPFTAKSSEGPIDSFRRQMYKSRYLTRLAQRLRGRNFSIYTRTFSQEDERFYVETLTALLKRLGVEFEYREDTTEKLDCAQDRLRMYRHAIEYIGRCFGASGIQPEAEIT